MSTRTKLLLSALACILCLFIVLSTDRSNQPFLRLQAEDIVSVEVSSPDVGVHTVTGREKLDDFSALLRALAVEHRTSPTDGSATQFAILTKRDITYTLRVTEGYISLDSAAYTADTVHTDALLRFAAELD